jgi:hypothetical protein
MLNLNNVTGYKEFTIKEDDAFRLRVRKWKCQSPSNLNSVEFIQECIRNGEVDFSSTYNFFMTDEELAILAGDITK